MILQQGISLEKNQTQVGKTLDVLIEGYGDGITLGRSYRDAPEIDGDTIIEGEIPPGELVPVRITGAMTYDLSGIVETQQTGIVIHGSFIYRRNKVRNPDGAPSLPTG